MEKDYFSHILPNGLRIVHLPSASPVSYCGFAVNAGTRDEEMDEFGLAHFVEHMIFKGTEKRKSWHILNRMENVGGELNAYTTKEETFVYSIFMEEHFRRAFELLSDLVFHSQFPEQEIEKEVDVILDEINSYEDSPSELIESELFGHERGAFTSAIKQRKGKFEQADGGTLFMDEIGDMSPAAQAKVLRALQERRISRVGSDKDIEVDVRVVAATNKDLREEIRRGNFREDLYHRIGVIVVRVPALREHAADIPLLTDHFIRLISAEYGLAPKPIDPEAVAALQAMPWSGNVRELRNVVERLLILSDGRITAADVKAYCN